MQTNQIKKGMRVQLMNGWMGTMYDNVKGNTRMVEVEGICREIGSVYAHDIKYAIVDGKPDYVVLTDKQTLFQKQVKAMGF
jgi:hypothetical protein